MTASHAQSTNAPSPVLAPGATLQKLAGDFKFTEGPSCDAHGNVFFTDQPNDRILKWSVDGKLSTFLQPAGRANGMYFDARGNLIACADEKTELWSITPDGKHTDADLPAPPRNPGASTDRRGLLGGLRRRLLRCALLRLAFHRLRGSIRLEPVQGLGLLLSGHLLDLAQALRKRPFALQFSHKIGLFLCAFSLERVLFFQPSRGFLLRKEALFEVCNLRGQGL
jgi:hypothetical protein